MGVCKVIAEGGLLSGYLSIQFILIFLACLLTLLSKALLLTDLTDTLATDDIATSITIFLLLTLPSLITGIAFIWHRSLFKTFLSHPSLLLLPMFSFFTFESNAQKCCANDDEVEIRFSVKATLFNIVFSLLGIIANACITATDEISPHEVATLVTGILLTIILLCFCSCPQNCSCSSPSFCFFSSSINASCSCYPPLEFGVFRPSSPLHQEVKEVEEIALEENQVDTNERGKEIMGVEEKEEEV